MKNLTPGSKLHHKLRLLKWLIPLGLVLAVIAYEVGPALWIYRTFGVNYHIATEIIFFGTIGPVLAYTVLELMDRWLTEKEIAELNASLLAIAKEKELEISQVSDDTIQVLFAAGLLITSLKSEQYDPALINTSQIEVTEQALHEAIQRLRSQIKLTNTV